MFVILINKNAISWGKNKDKKSYWKTNNNNSSLEDQNDQKTMNEFAIMKMLDHSNILKAVDIIYDDEKHPSILFEECSTNLNQVIQNYFFFFQKFNLFIQFIKLLKE